MALVACESWLFYVEENNGKWENVSWKSTDWNLEDLSSSVNSTTSWFCSLGQVTSILWAWLSSWKEWRFSLHDFNVFLPAQSVHWGALLTLFCSIKCFLLFQVFSSTSSLKWQMLYFKNIYYKPSTYLRVREQKMRSGGRAKHKLCFWEGRWSWTQAQGSNSLQVSWLWLGNPRLEGL